MITKAIATNLARELEGLDFPPDKGSPAMQVFTQTLANRSDTPAHARRIIDYILETCTKFPKPAEIVEIAAQVNPKPPSASAPINPSCPECEGTGYTFVVAFDAMATGAARCPRGCGIPGSEGRSDAMSTRALGDWYRQQGKGAATRRAAFVARQQGQGRPQGQLLLAQVERMGAGSHER